MGLVNHITCGDLQLKLLIFAILFLLFLPSQSVANTGKESCVSGNCLDGKGTYTLVDGRQYVGSFKDGKHHGNGTLSSPDGTTYTGTFKDGTPNGHGSFTLPNGDSYTGECNKSLPHGQGTYTFADGTTFSGKFSNGSLGGQGIAIISNGDKYVGEFKNNQFHGQGTFTLANGESYTGLFRDNVPVLDKQNIGLAKDKKSDMETTFNTARKIYSNAPDEKIDAFMAEQVKGMSAILPTKLNEGTELYRINWAD